MIDATNVAIRELAERIQRENARRHEFFRLLRATDRVLTRLEELNRDGIKSIPDPQRRLIREELVDLPAECAAVFHDSSRVQEVLNSIFEIQDRLFAQR
jgi:hypothetical protein